GQAQPSRALRPHMNDPAPAASPAIPDATLAPPHTRALTVEMAVIVVITLVATKTGEHLGLSTSNFFKEGRKKNAALVWGSMVAAATCVLLTYASWNVVQANRQGSVVLAGGIP